MMELTYNWQSFQTMFFPKRRLAAHSADGSAAGAVYLVVENGAIVTAYSEAEDLSDWIGAQVEDMAVEMPHRELYLFEREKMDQWITEAMALPHSYDQFDFLRRNATPQLVSSSKRGKKNPRQALSVKQAGALLVEQHFLLEAIQGWWAKILPSAYGIFVRLEGQPCQDLFVLVRRGRIEAFHEPDLSSMGNDRRRQAADVVKYLSEKHLVKVQGIFVPAREWEDWSASDNPWKRLALAVRSNQAKLVPFRWSLVTLMASKAFIGV